MFFELSPVLSVTIGFNDLDRTPSTLLDINLQKAY